MLQRFLPIVFVLLCSSISFSRAAEPDFIIKIESCRQLMTFVKERLNSGQVGAGDLMTNMLPVFMGVNMGEPAFKGLREDDSIYVRGHYSEGKLAWALYLPITSKGLFIDHLVDQSFIKKGFDYVEKEKVLILFLKNAKPQQIDQFSKWAKKTPAMGNKNALVSLLCHPKWVKRRFNRFENFMHSVMPFFRDQALSGSIQLMLQELKREVHSVEFVLSEIGDQVALTKYMIPQKSSDEVEVVKLIEQPNFLKAFVNKDMQYEMYGNINIQPSSLEFFFQTLDKVLKPVMGSSRVYLVKSLKDLEKHLFPAQVYGWASKKDRSKGSYLIYHHSLDHKNVLGAIKASIGVMMQNTRRSDSIYREVKLKEQSVVEGVKIYELFLSINKDHPIYRHWDKRSRSIKVWFSVVGNYLVNTSADFREIERMIKKIKKTHFSKQDKPNVSTKYFTLKGNLLETLNLSPLLSSLTGDKKIELKDELLSVQFKYDQPLNLSFFISQNAFSQILVNQMNTLMVQGLP